MSDRQIVVTVVVATYRRPERIVRLLRAIERQSIPASGIEVVVYDDASGDDTVAAVQAAALTAPYSLTLIEGDVNRGPAAGRNRAWRSGTAPVVAFIDDDCVPSPNWLESGLALLSHTGAAVVVGRVEPAPEQAANHGPFSRTLVVNDARFFATANCFYRRDVIESADGFDERFRRAAGEDTDLGLRVLEAGGLAEFSTDALVWHDVRPSEFRFAAKEAANKWIDLALVVRKHPDVRDTLMYRRVFWKRSHAYFIAAAAGVAFARKRPAALAAALPYLQLRLSSEPIAGGAGAVRTLPGAVAIDALEVSTMLRSSARHRSLVL